MAERRLIDVNDLIAVEWSPSEALGANGQIDAFERGMDKVIKYVKSMPTIEERKKGEWTEKEVIHKDEASKVIEEWQSAKCSNCGLYHTTPYLYSFFPYNYCPHCGTPMKGKQE